MSLTMASTSGWPSGARYSSTTRAMPFAPSVSSRIEYMKAGIRWAGCFKGADQGVLDRTVGRGPGNPGEENRHPRPLACTRGVPSPVVSGIEEDFRRVRMIEAVPRDRERRFNGNVLTKDHLPDIPQEIPEIFIAVIGQVGLARRDDGGIYGQKPHVRGSVPGRINGTVFRISFTSLSICSQKYPRYGTAVPHQMSASPQGHRPFFPGCLQVPGSGRCGASSRSLPLHV